MIGMTCRSSMKLRRSSHASSSSVDSGGCIGSGELIRIGGFAGENLSLGDRVAGKCPRFGYHGQTRDFGGPPIGFGGPAGRVGGGRGARAATPRLAVPACCRFRTRIFTPP